MAMKPYKYTNLFVILPRLCTQAVLPSKHWKLDLQYQEKIMETIIYRINPYRYSFNIELIELCFQKVQSQDDRPDSLIECTQTTATTCKKMSQQTTNGDVNLQLLFRCQHFEH